MIQVPQYVTVFLDESDVADAWEGANLKCAQFNKLIENGKVTAKYANTPTGHFVGRLGEIAAYKHLFWCGYEPNPCFIEDDHGGADIVLNNGWKIEVKTWQEHQWANLARAVSKKQLDTIASNDDKIIWCMVNLKHPFPHASSLHVYLRGWSTMSGFKSRAQEVKKKGANNVEYTSWQIPTDAGIGPMEFFFQQPGGMNDVPNIKQ